MGVEFEPVWDSIIAWYLFLAGLGGGAFASAAFLRWKHPEARFMRRAGHLIAPVVVIVGLLLLIVDAKGGLYNPWRFVFLLTNFNSVMTWGVVFLSVFTIVSLIAVLMDFLKKEMPCWLEIVGVVFAVAVAMYTGALLGVCKPFPLWNSALLPVLFLVSAFSTGAALVLAVGALFAGKEFDEVGLFKKAHFCLPLIEIVLVALLLFVTSSTSLAGWNSVASLVSGEWALQFWLVFVVLGLVLPSIIDGILLFAVSPQVEESRGAHGLSALVGLGVLVGGYFLRYLIVVAALPITVVAAAL
ncbi:NrfD/PsrC family molybdoenzyme membrane anchor subunit [Adlercreutzia shanghongiae]|uniref:NrfD/PsrC family molybdoenzyme membrane anchor subunit n=1 Tax=Adlercreutzia shanghongiae TaxID=3111773 RepID=A0ABU6IYE5_9ACTN|nr:NrfD/PsrC family molybdoenzyme membrane anchor subunit [Adlercreutzia sp. R22]MEC4294882.1 NrfD/PsrC family molybdoenzyme membrane anchor subunit [Adlercreutzia sp. R22]